MHFLSIIVPVLMLNSNTFGMENEGSEFLVLRRFVGNMTQLQSEMDRQRDYYQPNAGDLIYGSRQSSDILLIRDTFVVSEVTELDQEVQWSFNTNAKYTTTIRMLNFGDQKAFCSSIHVTPNQGTVLFVVPGNTNPRVMLEAYGLVR